MKSYLEVLKKYAVFNGRARRKEYWTFFLCNVGIGFVLALIDLSLGTVTPNGKGVFVGLYHLAIFVPSVALGVRRMHDTNHRGWWAFVPFANLVLVLKNGDHGPNQFGRDPKEIDAAAPAIALERVATRESLS
jgi:uncharacterized membrane protein YhaH (DUF805 family)